MTANKRQKLDTSGSRSGSGASTPVAMSAFAARQQLWGAAAAAATVRVGNGKSVDEKAAVQQQPAPEDDATRPRRSRSETPSSRPAAGRRSKRQPTEEPPSADQAQAQVQTQGVDTAGEGDPGTVIKLHSSLRPSKNNIQRKPGGRLVLTTTEGERLVILGSYGIEVRQGEVTIAGAILTPADGIQWVHSPHCHAVPVLRTADDTVLELQLHPAAKALRQLGHLNPAFGNLWTEASQTTVPRSNSAPSFQMVFTSQDVPRRAALQELVSPAEWNKKLAALAAAKRKGTPVIFLCGPKSSGKSTFGRLLANRFMTDRGGSRNTPWSSVLVLDLDPGQPEYSPPGVISLSKMTTPNLSPSFCHPTLTPEDGQVRAHAIASVTPAQDPAHFLACAADLVARYRQGPDAASPLVINTPGWIQGTGLDILTELIAATGPTQVIYMSHDGPEETVDSLRAACAATAPPTPFFTLPSQPTDAPSYRTAQHFRTMQTMSYFHLTPEPGPQTWNPTPLTALRPWRVRYAGPARGILGILCYDHQPAPSLLPAAINGTVLALVRLEDPAAEVFAANPLLPLPPSLLNTEHAPTTNPTTEKAPLPLPHIPNPQGQTLSPSTSHLLSLVLVRGIDPVRGELHLLTPLPPAALAAAVADRESGKSDLVLVAGRFDTPCWAYTEDFYAGREKGKEGGGDGEGDGEGEGEVPWVEVLKGGEGREVGSKVWRVRRDLGRGG